MTEHPVKVEPWQAGPRRLPDGSTETRAGEIVTMADGARWFHPYSGGAPTRLEDRSPTAGGDA